MIRAYPLRALVLWVALHAFVVLVTGAKVVVFETATSVALVVISGAIGFIDTRRRREFTMLGNLGVSSLAPAALWAGTVLALEIALRALGSIAFGPRA